MPSPKKGEHKKKFIKRCISYMYNEEPDKLTSKDNKNKQAYAICNSTFDRRNKKKNEIKKYDDFVNEGLLSNLFSKIKGYLSDGLKELVKDTKTGDPKKMIKSLKKYVELNGDNINKELKNINTKEDLKDYLRKTIQGLYTAIKGVQSTEKIEPTYFDDMFKKADKTFVKLMNSKPGKFKKSIDIYIDKLVPNLYKLAGIELKKESFIFEDNQNEREDSNNNKGEEDNQDEKGDDKKKTEDTKKEKSDEVPDKVKKATKTWLINILKPIIDKKMPDGLNDQDNSSGNNKVWDTKDDSVVRKDVIKDMVKNADLNHIKRFREEVGDSKGIDDVKNKWPVGK